MQKLVNRASEIIPRGIKELNLRLASFTNFGFQPYYGAFLSGFAFIMFKLWGFMTVFMQVGEEQDT